MAYNPYYNNNPYFQPQPNYYANSGAVPDMLNQQKMQYQQPQIQQMPIPQPPISSNDTMLWVLGEVEATSYPVAPNNTVTLWDKNQDTIYIKSVNAQGVPSMKILDFTERNTAPQNLPEKHTCKCGDKFVSKDDFDALQAKFDELTAIVNDMKSKPTTKTTKSSKGDAE